MTPVKPPPSSSKKGSESLGQGGDKVGPIFPEDRVLKLTGLNPEQPTRLFVDFVEKLQPRITLPPTSFGILNAFANIDVTAERVAQSLKLNPYYGHYFRLVIEALGKREDAPSFEAAVVLLGMQNSRNLIVTLQALRTVLGEAPQIDDKGKLARAPADVCKRAIRTEEILIGKKSGYADTAYAAGLAFDLLHLAASVVGPEGGDPKAAQEYIDLVYAHGLKTATVGMELAKLLPDFAFKKYVFSACLIHDIGKAAMAALNPEFVSFTSEAQKKGLPRGVRFYCEGSRFGVQHAVIGSMVCRSFRIFRPIERAVLHHHDPYVLKTTSKGLYELSALVSLASNIATHFKKTDKADDPIWEQWRGPELKDFRVDPRGILKAVAKLNF